MEGTYDPQADAAFLYYTPTYQPKEVAKTLEVKEDSDIFIDLDKEGRLLKIEILHASKRLPQSLLESLVINGAKL